jgi:hypothetical protein
MRISIALSAFRETSRKVDIPLSAAIPISVQITMCSALSKPIKIFNVHNFDNSLVYIVPIMLKNDKRAHIRRCLYIQKYGDFDKTRHRKN